LRQAWDGFECPQRKLVPGILPPDQDWRNCAKLEALDGGFKPALHSYIPSSPTKQIRRAGEKTIRRGDPAHSMPFEQVSVRMHRLSNDISIDMLSVTMLQSVAEDAEYLSLI
jgi:hypothetical protein